MVVVGAWRRNDSRMGGLQDRTTSNFDNEVLAATDTSPVAIMECFLVSLLKPCAEEKRNSCTVAFLDFRRGSIEDFPANYVTTAARSCWYVEDGLQMSHRWRADMVNFEIRLFLAI
jgi:hypothetical protein